MESRRWSGESRGFAGEPLLAEGVNDAWQILPEHLSELSLYLPLDEPLEDGYRVESRADVERFERVVLEDEGDALLFRDNKDDDSFKFEVGETEGHWDEEWTMGGERGSRGREGRGRFFERVCLSKGMFVRLTRCKE
jgi:hypothetical protein